MIYVDVINQSTEASDKTIQYLILALQKQVIRDFEPIWGITCTLLFIPKGMKPNPDHWQLVFLDTADQAGALGYHDLTPTGLPLGKVFIRTTELDGGAWSVTASHELLEMLADPYANTATLVLETNTSGTCFAYEVCDACESDNLGYVINQFKVSDFVTPDWFNPDTMRPNTKYDFMGHIPSPLELLPGGYIGVYQIPNKNGWEQNTKDQTVRPKGRFCLRQKTLSERKLSAPLTFIL